MTQECNNCENTVRSGENICFYCGSNSLVTIKGYVTDGTFEPKIKYQPNFTLPIELYDED